MFDHHHILEQLAQLNHRPEDLAKAAGISLVKLAQILCDGSNFKKLEDVLRMQNMHRELMLTQCKLTAIGKLMEIATGDGPQETQRKACVDILKATCGVLEKPRGGSPKPVKRDPFIYDKPTPAEEEAILNALQKIGEESMGRNKGSMTQRDFTHPAPQIAGEVPARHPP